jgi:hypothetical protein
MTEPFFVMRRPSKKYHWQSSTDCYPELCTEFLGCLERRYLTKTPRQRTMV